VVKHRKVLVVDRTDPASFAGWSISVHRSPFAVRRSAFTVQRSAFTVHRSPFTVHRSPFGVHRSAFSVQRSAFGVRRSGADGHIRWVTAKTCDYLANPETAVPKIICTG
jgi:hypothetical protein